MLQHSPLHQRYQCLIDAPPATPTRESESANVDGELVYINRMQTRQLVITDTFAANVKHTSVISVDVAKRETISSRVGWDVCAQ